MAASSSPAWAARPRSRRCWTTSPTRRPCFSAWPEPGDNMAVIGFIGLGHMGLPMACRLKEAGHEVRCFDLDAKAMERARDAGLKPRAAVVEAVAGAQIVVTMLPSGRHVLGVLRDGALPFAPGALVIDCSTI